MHPRYQRSTHCVLHELNDAFVFVNNGEFVASAPDASGCRSYAKLKCYPAYVLPPLCKIIVLTWNDGLNLIEIEWRTPDRPLICH